MGEAEVRTGFTAFVESMSFSGAIPELLNGRLAMLGFVEALEAEMLGKGPVVEQLRIGGAADALYDLVVVMIVAMVVVGTIVPYSRKNLYPQDANWGRSTRSRRCSTAGWRCSGASG